jgi:hypothetical protein
MRNSSSRGYQQKGQEGQLTSQQPQPFTLGKLYIYLLKEIKSGKKPENIAKQLIGRDIIDEDGTTGKIIDYYISTLGDLYISMKFGDEEYAYSLEDLEKEYAQELRKTRALKILSVEASELCVGEWGELRVRVSGQGKASLSVEGDVEYISLEPVDLHGKELIKVPVKPKISGKLPIKVTIEAYGKRVSKTLWLKVEEKVKRCPICGAPIEPGAKYCWNCGARLEN